MTEEQKQTLSMDLVKLWQQELACYGIAFEIGSYRLECLRNWDFDGMTPEKRQIIDALVRRWHLLQSIHDDLLRTAAAMGQAESVPEIPELNIDAEPWKSARTGNLEALGAAGEILDELQSALGDCSQALREMLD